jgi:hypothetical protein
MNFRDRYLEALGTSDPVKIGAARDRAYEIRQFEIDLYWKRAAYFWAFQLIAFTSLGLLFKDGNITSLRRLLLPASLGVITAFAGYLTARGSKFWQENWEAHVDLLEGDEARLTQVILCRRQPQFFVSRVNQALLLLLTLGWVAALLLGAFPGLAPWLSSAPIWLQDCSIPICVAFVCGCLWFTTKTSVAGRVYSPGDENWTLEPSAAKASTTFMIWRGTSPAANQEAPLSITGSAE